MPKYEVSYLARQYYHVEAPDEETAMDTFYALGVRVDEGEADMFDIEELPEDGNA